MYNYTVRQSDYIRWLEAKVWVTGNKKARRKEYIPILTDSLTYFMKKCGYTMNGKWNSKAVAKWLYAIQIQEVARKNKWGDIIYPKITHRDWPEDRDIFESEVTFDKCEEFLESWKNNEDLEPNYPSGERVRIEITTLLYNYIDLESSKHGKRIARLLEESDSEDSETEEIDIYLQDAKDGWHSYH